MMKTKGKGASKDAPWEITPWKFNIGPENKPSQKESISMKTNMEPENHPFEKEFHLPNLHCWVPC